MPQGARPRPQLCAAHRGSSSRGKAAPLRERARPPGESHSPPPHSVCAGLGRSTDRTDGPRRPSKGKAPYLRERRSRPRDRRSERRPSRAARPGGPRGSQAANRRHSAAPPAAAISAAPSASARCHGDAPPLTSASGSPGLAGALRWSGIAPRGRGRRPQNPAGSPEPRDHLPLLRGFPAPKRCPARSAPRFLPLPRGCTGAALAAPRPWMGEKGRGDGVGRPRPPPAPRPPQAQLQRAFAFRSSGSTAAALPRSAPRVYSRLARAARAAAPPGRSEPFKITSTDRARIVVGSTWTASKGKRGVVPEPRRGGSRICPLGCRALPVPRVGGSAQPGEGAPSPPRSGAAPRSPPPGGVRPR